MVWLSMYDDDILCEVFKMKIAYCKVNILPYSFCSYTITDMEVCLGSKRGVYLRKSEGSIVLTRAYLISIDQAFDVIRYKNYKIEMQKL